MFNKFDEFQEYRHVNRSHIYSFEWDHSHKDKAKEEILSHLEGMESDRIANLQSNTALKKLRHGAYFLGLSRVAGVAKNGIAASLVSVFDKIS